MFHQYVIFCIQPLVHLSFTRWVFWPPLQGGIPKKSFTISCHFAEIHLKPVCFGYPGRFFNFSSSSSFTSIAKPDEFWQFHSCLFLLTVEMEEMFRNPLGKQVNVYSVPKEAEI